MGHTLSVSSVSSLVAVAALVLTACGHSGDAHQCEGTVEQLSGDLPDLFSAWAEADFPTRGDDPEAFSRPFEQLGESLGTEPAHLITAMRDSGEEPWAATVLGDLLVIHFPEGTPDGAVEDPTLIAYALDTAAPVWAVTDTNSSFDRFPQLITDSLIVHLSGSEDHADVYGIDPQTGQTVGCSGQAIGEDSVVSATAATGGDDIVFTNGDAGTLSRLDVSDGQLLWEADIEEAELLHTSDWAVVDDELIALAGYRDPASTAPDTEQDLDADVATVDYDPLLTRAYSLQDGQLLWEHPVSGSAYPLMNAGEAGILLARTASPDQDEDHRQVGFMPEEVLHGLEIVDPAGESLWATERQPANSPGQGTVVDDLVIWADSALRGSTTAWELSTGETRWEISDAQLTDLNAGETVGVVDAANTTPLDDSYLIPTASGVTRADPATGDIEFAPVNLGGMTRQRIIGVTETHLVMAPTYFTDNQALTFVIYER
ncbi:PQQ-binding-like beta-propeller repeat protein [Nesterenkonia muleiensis]|uniref:outer membrane protein assembly factor BamB family protein n=1 Tax=Nesterenkonia muleiensis TaxID=2282648 RepID=UPI000E745630|nr:PQQ-binding-like beta-propeller repeat protein [Nesterenkonia muleiensis]